MRKGKSAFSLAFTVILLVYAMFMFWYIPSRASLDFRLADAEKSLKTSQGRERKQQYEYEQAAAELPRIEEQLGQVLPLTEEVQKQVDELKAEKKELKKEKKRLEALLKDAPSAEIITDSADSGNREVEAP